MSLTASVASPVAANPLARFTIGLFGLFPMSLTMLVLRLTLALPFWKSGLTKWDGWFTLSFGAQALFTDEFKLHILGAHTATLAKPTRGRVARQAWHATVPVSPASPNSRRERARPSFRRTRGEPAAAFPRPPP